MKLSIASALVTSAGLAAAHMEMTYPAPFRSKFNPIANPNAVDYSMTAPLANSGTGGFPCKGYQVDLGTPYGASVATWSPGSQRNMTITGGAAHEGGSCQASLSYDGGKTFTVIHSFIGNCPVLGTSSFDFTVPADAPTGPAVFSWSWNNKVGNREMYMNCASITIAGAPSRRASPAVAFSARPAIFIGNVDNSPCGTLEGADVMYPSPGPSDDTTVDSSKTAPPTNINGGRCPVDASSNPAPSSPNSPSDPVNAVNPASPAPSSSQLVGGVFVTTLTGTVAPKTAGQATLATPLISYTMLTAPVSSSSETGTPSATIPLSFVTDSPAGPVPQPIVTSAPSALVPAPATISGPSAPIAAPAATSGPSVPVPASPSAPTSAGLQTVGTPCVDEGLWNCINNGAAFQRCASGQWSAIISMAAGTACVPGMSANLVTRGLIRGASGLRNGI